MGPSFFKRRDPSVAKRDADSTQFASTVFSAAMPEGLALPWPRIERSPLLRSSIGTESPLPRQAGTAAAPDSDLGAAASGGPATDPGADSEPTPVDVSVEQQPTISHVGRYALKGTLGQGGLGQVHEAWDPLLSRNVAIKTLQFDLDAATRQSLDGLFLNEARAAARLSHPNIVTVHDAGLSEHGVYIAMERLHGCDLRQRLAGGWRPKSIEAAHLVRRIAEALAYAHTSGVVHCDVKPANIFLNKRDRPKLLDFGIARVTRNKALLGGGGDLDGAVAGSPHYLAPEQVQGGAVDARTDIHGLGVVLYEMLTLRKAFEGSNLLQITARALASDPRPAHELREGVPKALSAIAAKAMSRDPAQRYASAAEMAHELRRWADRHAREASLQASKAVGARSDRRSRRSSRSASRHGLPAFFSRVSRKTVVTTASLALVALLGLALAWRSPAPVDATAADASAQTQIHALVDAPPAQGLAKPAEIHEPPPVSTSKAATPAAVKPATFTSAGAESARAAAAEPAPSIAKAVIAPVIAPTSAPAIAPTSAPASAARPARQGVNAARVAANGTVNLAISPWGNVDIDGAPAGTTPPLSTITLSEGTHVITVRNAEFSPFVTTVRVRADKPVTVRHRFGQ